MCAIRFKPCCKPNLVYPFAVCVSPVVMPSTYVVSAAEDIPRADEVKTLIKDIWDMRLAKLRSSIDVFVKSDATHAKVILHRYFHSQTLSIVTMSSLPRTVFPLKGNVPVTSNCVHRLFC